MQIEEDKSCNDSKTLQDYTRHVEQQPHGRKTHAETTPIHPTSFKNCASLLRVHKTVQYVHTYVRVMHCNNLDLVQLCACPLFLTDLMGPLKRKQ